MFHHLNESFAGNISICFPVDGVAEFHVVRRDSLSHRSGSSTGLEEISGNFLTGSYFSKSSVLISSMLRGMLGPFL